MGTVGATDSTYTLSEVQVRLHEGIRIDEPGIDVVSCVIHIDIGAIDNPGKGVVQDGVGHGLEISRVVHQPDIWVELTVAGYVFA